MTTQTITVTVNGEPMNEASNRALLLSDFLRHSSA